MDLWVWYSATNCVDQSANCFTNVFLPGRCSGRLTALLLHVPHGRDPESGPAQQVGVERLHTRNRLLLPPTSFQEKSKLGTLSCGKLRFGEFARRLTHQTPLSSVYPHQTVEPHPTQSHLHAPPIRARIGWNTPFIYKRESVCACGTGDDQGSQHAVLSADWGRVPLAAICRIDGDKAERVQEMAPGEPPQGTG